uniref:Transposase n=1 Tax=Acrobeloides nanus TaxID=290746 RepID=A0A914DI72_9BILA
MRGVEGQVQWGRHRNNVFSDEKPLCIEQICNQQDDQIWSKEKPPTERRVIQHTQKPKWIYVWACVTQSGKGPLVFIDKDVKINRWNYMEMLKQHLLPWAKEKFGWDEESEEYQEEWTFQQDSAPGHKAKETQQWLRYIESKACEKSHKSIASLKRAIKKAWDEMPDEMVARVVDTWPDKLQACIDAEGGYIE